MVDVISGGRLILGIGAGYAPEEFCASNRRLFLPFDSADSKHSRDGGWRPNTRRLLEAGYLLFQSSRSFGFRGPSLRNRLHVQLR
jgi:hypothetical protein